MSRPRSFSRAAVDDAHLRAALVSVAELARCSLVGAEATVAVLVEGEPVTLAATEPSMVELDAFQYETGEGPCLDAVREGRTVHVDFVDDGARYPRFGPRALMASVTGALSQPLQVDGAIVGSLNLFARSPNALGEAALRPAWLLAAQAAAAVAGAQERDDLRRQVTQLELAVASRDVIGQAKGILMLQSGLGPDEAFALLIRASQRENRKLRDIAQDIADRASKQATNGAPRKAPPR
jgi:transcriptional regulator with GAF, ATPase, and Fis domain